MKKVLLVNLLATALLVSGCSVNNSIEQSSSNETSSSSFSIVSSSTSSSSSSEIPIPVEPDLDVIDDYTIMIYLCGSDLESRNGLAFSDIREIKNVTKMPDNVNIIVQTGGASSWTRASGIKNGEIGRYQFRDKKLKKITALDDADMGDYATFKDFIIWGVSEFPAEKTGVIMWDHGGGMAGCCYDEVYGNYLTPSEQDQALTEAFNELCRTEKLEWIGYDCCLMAVQDIADNNSKFFNYFVASQETEAGEGWDYDNWVDDLYANSKIDTETLLAEICRSFVADNFRKATLSALDLSKMPAYKAAWESVVRSININSSSKMNTLKSVVKECMNFADGECELYDAKQFIAKGKTTYSSYSAQWKTLSDAFDELVITNETTSDYKDVGGLNFFCPTSRVYPQSIYSESATNFVNWRNICVTYGSWSGK